MKAAGWISLLAVVAGSSHGVAAPAESSPPTNPYAQFDSDGVPLAVTESPRHPFTSEQIAALRKAAQQEVRDQNWLLIEYQHQQEVHAASGAGGSTRPNIFLQLSMDKNLAELAGVDRSNSVGTISVPSLHATPSPTSAATASLRPEAAGPQPFSPMSTAGTAVIQNMISTPSFFSTLGSGMGISGTGPFAPSSNGDATVLKPSSAHSDAYLEATDLQTPGMVAAKTDSVESVGPPDLSLDSLPNESEEAAREAAASSPPQLSQAMSADTLHELQDAKIATPTLAAQTRIPPSEMLARKVDTDKPQIIPVNPDDAPMQVTKQPMINPVHPAMSSPLNVLNR